MQIFLNQTFMISINLMKSNWFARQQPGRKINQSD